MSKVRTKSIKCDLSIRLLEGADGRIGILIINGFRTIS